MLLGVAVIVGVAVGVFVGVTLGVVLDVAVDVAVGVGLGVNVGVGDGSDCAQYRPPVFKSPPSYPPQTIISVPLQIAV